VSVIERESEFAAVFNALTKLRGADLTFVTRSRVEARSADEVCTSVWGMVIRLKKGPTVGGELPAPAGALPVSPTPVAGSAQLPVP